MLINISKNILDFVLPPRCPVSGDKVDIQGSLSPDIWSQIIFIEDPKCQICGLPFAYADQSYDALLLCGQCIQEKPCFHEARAGVLYDDASRDLILKYKHADKTALVVSFRPWLRHAGEEMLQNADALVPVPLHPLRLFHRRFNQACLIANDLGRIYNLPVFTNVLTRIRHTPTQGHKNAKERRRNVKKAFSVQHIEKYALTGKNVVIVDDVFTTGATVNECAKELIKAGVNRVSVLTLARVARL